MIELGILPAELPRIIHNDAIFKELSYQLQFAHKKRLEFAAIIRGQLDKTNSNMMNLRQLNVSTKTSSLDLLV